MPDTLEAPPEVQATEARRRRREAALILLTALAVVAFAVFETRLPQFTNGATLGTDAVLVLLINLNLILLVLLVFLVGRNIVKLFLDRRRRTLGSHLRTRLVLAFIGIALLPATLLFLVAQVFVSNSIEDWFNGQVESALEGSLDVTHAYYEDLASTALGFARRTARQVVERGLLGPGKREELKRFLQERREEYQLDLVEVFADGQPLARARAADLPQEKVGVEPTSPLLGRAARGEEATAIDAVGEGDVIRAAAPIDLGTRIAGVVVVDAWVPNSVTKRREQIDRSFGEYLRLKIQRRPIRTAYTITLVLVCLVVLFSATWVGFYVARGITVPIQQLAEGTRAVAQGDLEVRIAGEGDDELGTLVKAFNGMTGDLQRSRAELDARRRDLEIVLAHIAAGVVSADAAGRIVTMNPAAERLLGRSAAASVGRPLLDVFPGEAHAELRSQLRALLAGSETALEMQLSLEHHGHELAVLLTGTLVGAEGSPQGLVCFLEDVTHLLRVERMEAWREVARRIAHEIKNPLTPIQLAAQRLRRRYGAQLRENGAVFEECTRTIIQQVDELKALVNEFATFARMPQREHRPEDLNAVVEEALVLFREGHPRIAFTFDAAADLPALELDREGLKRAVINLVDNAVAACAARPVADGDDRRHVRVSTAWDRRLDVVRLEVADDGIGMTREAKARIFEPYFSTKPDGTGLGLAIVSAIVADPKGFIRVRDEQPHGSRFVIELPLRSDAAHAHQARRGAFGA
jgi:two-component system nitrogen regulation sensor histidine kinase NtrY